jgi:hypothetical protein
LATASTTQRSAWLGVDAHGVDHAVRAPDPAGQVLDGFHRVLGVEVDGLGVLQPRELQPVRVPVHDQHPSRALDPGGQLAPETVRK